MKMANLTETTKVKIEQPKNTNLGSVTKETFLTNYKGNFAFLLDVQAKFMKYGNLSEGQWGAVQKCLDREQPKTEKEKPKPIDSSKLLYLRKYIAFAISEKFNLGTLRSFVWQTEQVLNETPKAIQVRAKILDAHYPLGICRNCGRALTDEFSIASGMGKTCAKRWGVAYIKNLSEVEKFRAEMQLKIDAVGTLEFWIPKSQITSETQLMNDNNNGAEEI